MAVQHFSVRNVTDIATEWAASPVGVMVRVEALVTVSCALLATLVFLGSSRRTSSSAAFRGVVWLALMLSYPAVAYTIGLMQSGSFGNDVVVVWACFLLSCADGIGSCSVDGSDRQARTIFLNQAAQVVTVFLLLLSNIRSLHPQLRILLGLLWLLNVAKLGMRLVSLLSSSRESTLPAENRLISNYMACKDVSSMSGFDPATMSGYKYVVAGEKDVHAKVSKAKDVEGSGPQPIDVGDEDGMEKKPAAGMVVKPADLVTVDMVWQCKGSLLSSSSAGNLKDLCLSLALFKLLRLHLDESPLYEVVSNNEIRGLVLVRKVLASGDDHERMFRVIEVELGFLFDYFYARYPSPKETLIPETVMFAVAVALSLSTLISPALLHYQHPQGSDTNDTVTTYLVGIWLARLVIVLFLILELFQYLSLVLSDWHKVKVLCRYVRSPEWWKERPIMEMLVGLMCRATLTTSYWSNSVGQYNLLHACRDNERSLLLRMPLHRRIKELIIQTRRVTRRRLPVAVKLTIRELLSSDCLSNMKYGDRTLQRHDKLQDFDWATSRYQHGVLESILMWHIATTICDDNDSAAGKNSDREVATTLSNYCSYLLFQAPELVTQEVYKHRLLMEALQSRVQKEFGAVCRSKDGEETLLADEGAQAEEVILRDGVRLGTLLLDKSTPEEKRWEMLAQMWVELLLTVARSGNITHHVNKLATGGELITHLWALLMHGGMVKMPTKPDYEPPRE